MTYTSTLTSKGQMTLPAALRKKLGLKPGEQVLLKMRGNEVIVQKNNWLQDLRAVQKANQSHLKKHSLKPLLDHELESAINSAAQDAAVARYRRSQ